MADEKKTVWQNLEKVLDIYGGTEDSSQKQQKIIIRGKSPEDIKRKALEIEQQQALNKKYNKLNDHGFQKAMQYEAARLPAYLDYEGMEYYPLIASALDLFMEEATTIDKDGHMLKVYSDKQRIKQHLEDFFYNIVNVNVNLPFWTRNLPIHEDSMIPLLNGSEMSIKDISKKIKDNPKEEIWTYSINTETNNIVGGKIVWCEKTRKDSQLVRVTLDDGTYIDTTPDHQFMVRNGDFVEAKDLKENQSLMPFYTRISEKPKDNIHGYEKVYNPKTNHYKYTYSIVSHELHRNLNEDKKSGLIYDTHHKDFNKLNNHPDNLERLTRDEHFELHRKIADDKKYLKSCNISKSKIINHKVVSVEYLENKSDVYCMEVVGKNGEHDRHNFAVCTKKDDGTYSRNGVFVSNCKYGDNFVYLKSKKKQGITHVKQMVNYEMTREEKVKDNKSQVIFRQRETSQDFNIFEIAHFRLLGDDKYLPYGSSILNKIRRAFRQLILAEDSMLTYRITRAGEKRIFNIDVGNMDEDDIEEYMGKVISRFKKQQNVNFETGQIDYRYNVLGVDEDYFMPKRNGSNTSSIETLPGAQNLDQIADINYLRDNLFTGLGVPKPFLGFQQAAGDGKNMAQMDIRFSKKINRIQQAIIQELNKMAMIHLYLLGFEEDYTNFSLSLTNPSTQQEMLMNEMMQSKAQIYTEVTRNEGGIAAMSHTNAKRLLFNMSDEEIIEDFKIQRMERALSQELQDTPLVIPKTGVFTDLDDKYGSGDGVQSGMPAAGQEGMDQTAGGGIEGIDEPNMPPVDGGGGALAPQSPAELPPVQETKKMDDKEYDELLEKMVKSSGKIKVISKKPKNRKVINENTEKVKGLNDKAIQMANEIDEMLKKNDDTLNDDILLSEALSGERLVKIVNENLGGGTTDSNKDDVSGDTKKNTEKDKKKK